jgi:hypothetical protein
MKKDLTYEEAHRRWNYNPETGILTRKTNWAGYRIGEEAGSLNDGYVVLHVGPKLYSAHRVAWLMYYGYFPEYTIDHKNRIRHDNRITNLREATPQCQSRNAGINSRNSSGVIGVHWSKASRKWKSQIVVDGITIYLGYFPNFTDAVLARWQAEKEHNFPNCCTISSSFQWLKNNEPFLYIDLLLDRKYP